MNKTTKTVGAGVATIATIALTATSASADNSIVKIKKYGELSASHRIAWIGVKVTCSEDTTSAQLTATLTQVTHGSVQSNTGQVTSINAFECTGEEELVYVPVRRPTGGFAWVKGAARASNVSFITQDPSGTFTDTAKGRTIYLR